jgi:hypothetical protein
MNALGRKESAVKQAFVLTVFPVQFSRNRTLPGSLIIEALRLADLNEAAIDRHDPESGPIAQLVRAHA